MPKLFVAPSEPLSLKPYSVTSTTVTLQWMPPRYPNGVITKYSVHFDGTNIHKFGSNVSNKMMGTVDGLSPDTQYVLEMKAHTKVGAGQSTSLSVRTSKLLNRKANFRQILH